MNKILLTELCKPKLLCFLFLAAMCHLADAQFLFNESVQILESSGYYCSIGYLNNDTFPDIYFGRIWLNNGDGTFTAKQSICDKNITHNVAFADLDGDGDLDIFLSNDASYESNSIYATGCPNEVWFNDGEGNFTNSGQLLGHEPSGWISLADVDNDGDMDAVVSNYHDGIDYTKYKPDEVWKNDGNGIFTIKQTMGYGMGPAVLGDIDNDGDIDALDKDTIWFNNGSGIFSKSTITIKAGERTVPIFGDLDNDGDIDAFIAKWNLPAQIWLNDGSGNFTDSKQRLGNMQTNYPQLNDIDNDGDLDVFTDNYGGRCKLWINQGGKQNGTYGIFEDSNLQLPSGTGMLYDFNKDGKKDAIIANKIWINVYEATSVDEIKDPKIHVFPNLAFQTIQIKGTNSLLNKTNYHLVDLNGKTIKQGKLESETIDVSELPKGTYMLSLNISEGIIIEKIVVE